MLAQLMRVTTLPVLFLEKEMADLMVVTTFTQGYFLPFLFVRLFAVALTLPVSLITTHEITSLENWPSRWRHGKTVIRSFG